MDTTQRLRVLLAEIEVARQQLQPTGTGHIHTAIAYLQARVAELKKLPHL